MLVYRIEDSDGYGPFRHPDGRARCLSGVIFNNRHHPVPVDDGINGMHRLDVCGFISIDAAIDWFGKYVDKLEEEGVYLSVYKIKKKFVKFGKRQVCFLLHRAILVGHVNRPD
jgi:hypothetical protein